MTSRQTPSINLRHLSSISDFEDAASSIIQENNVAVCFFGFTSKKSELFLGKVVEKLGDYSRDKSDTDAGDGDQSQISFVAFDSCKPADLLELGKVGVSVGFIPRSLQYSDPSSSLACIQAYIDSISVHNTFQNHQLILFVERTEGDEITKAFEKKVGDMTADFPDLKVTYIPVDESTNDYSENIVFFMESLMSNLASCKSTVSRKLMAAMVTKIATPAIISAAASRKKERSRDSFDIEVCVINVNIFKFIIFL